MAPFMLSKQLRKDSTVALMAPLVLALKVEGAPPLRPRLPTNPLHRRPQRLHQQRRRTKTLARNGATAKNMPASLGVAANAAGKIVAHAMNVTVTEHVGVAE